MDLRWSHLFFHHMYTRLPNKILLQMHRLLNSLTVSSFGIERFTAVVQKKDSATYNK